MAASRPKTHSDIALPRALDPQKFSLAREPEVAALCQALKSSLKFGGERYGVQGIPRKLRRRTKSHNPYSHRRRPNTKKQAFATAQVAHPDPAENTGKVEPEALLNRRMRRRPAKLLMAALESAHWCEENLQFSPIARTWRRLETHVWHAKRLEMRNAQWGWTLPTGQTGRGRGSRGFASRLAAGAIMHDASYWCPLSLSGPAEAVRKMFAAVLDPEFVRTLHFEYRWEAQTMLYGVQSFPRGAIAPVFVNVLKNAVESTNQVCIGIWIHAAAAFDAYDALESSITDAMATDTCRLTVTDVRRIEIRGGNADAVLAKALRCEDAKLPTVLNELKLHAAVELKLPDPRLTKAVTLASASVALLPPEIAQPIQEDSNLMAAQPLPAPEGRISQIRQALRESLAVGMDATAAGLATKDMLKSAGTHCHAVLVRQALGWSILLPPGWVMPFWLALAFEGCQSAGQREWRWAHALQCKPFFPHDMPDTAAYTMLMQQMQEEEQAMARTKPKGKQPSNKPLQPAWCWLMDGLSDAPLQGEQHNGDADAKAPIEKPAMFIARSEGTALHFVFSDGDADKLYGEVCTGTSARPVAVALRSRQLQWQPAASRPLDADARLCFVETLVQCIKRGSACQGAMICTIKAREAERTTGPLYLKQSPDLWTDVDSIQGAPKEFVSQQQLTIIGWITSPAPHGMPRTAASLAICGGAAFWRLRSLQYYEPLRDRGTVQAWLSNPGSTVLFPVKLSLSFEKRQWDA